MLPKLGRGARPANWRQNLQFRVEHHTDPARVADAVITDRTVGTDRHTGRVALVEDIPRYHVQLEFFPRRDHAQPDVRDAVGALDTVPGKIVVEILFAPVYVARPG